MKLEEALKVKKDDQYLVRRAWVEGGYKVKLMTSAKTVKESNLVLSPHSLEMDDWEIVDE